MFSQVDRRGVSILAIVIAVLVAVIAVGGYFFYKRTHEPPKKPVVQKPVTRPVKRPAKPVEPVKKTTARMAIVIDDWGYNRSHCQSLESITAPLGIAILPHLTYSVDVINCAKAAGKEPMLHLPMEPHSVKEMYTRGYVLTTEMSATTVKKVTDKILKEMPGVVGVNNHTGSKATESPLVMTAALSVIKSRGLFFVDSMTSDKSVGVEVAERLKMKVGRRDVFLDNRNERVAIEKQFAWAARIGRENGYVLVIGHDRALTLQIIKEQVEKLRKEGFEFLTIKEYIKQYGHPGN